MNVRLLLYALACLLGATSLPADDLTQISVCEALDACGCSASAELASNEVFCRPECDYACSACCTGWYAQVEAFLLHRNNGVIDRTIVQTDLPPGDPVLTTHDLGFSLQAGPRILIGRQTGVDRAWELSYFGTHFWDASAIATDINNLDIPDPLVAVANDFDNADQMLLTYASRLNNAEFNLVSERESWTLLAGFRFLSLAERFNINALDNDGDVSDYLARTSNNLFGAQLGARVQRCASQRVSWELVGKAGVFGNDASQRLLLQDNDNTFELLNTTARRGTVSFVGDLNFTGSYALNDVWSLRGGYFVMYVNGLALAPDQLDFTNDLDTGTRITTRGNLFVHGVNLGLEASW